MGYFTPERKKWWTIILLTIGWALLLAMLLAVFEANTKFRLILFGLYVGVVFVSNIVLVIFRVKIRRIGRTIFSRTPDLFVFILVGFLLFNWFALYVAAYHLPNSIGSPGMIAALIFAVAIFVNLPSDVLKFVLPRYLLVMFSVFIAIVAIEIFLSNYGKYQVWESNLNQLFIPADGVMPGIEGESHFTTDGYGIRGDPYDSVDKDAYRILAVGGSTTETLYLDNTEAWPYLIQQLANADNQLVWVGNVGRSAHTSIDHYIVLKELVPNFDIDTVVIMVGVNDIMFLLQYPELDVNLISISDDPLEFREKELGYFEQSDFQTAEWRSGLLISLDLFSYTFQSFLEQRFYSDHVEIEDQVGQIYEVRRQLRQSASPIVDTLPDNFDEGLSVYRANLTAIVTEAQKQGINLVLATQSYVWSDSMPEDFDRYLWLGIIYDSELSPIGRYSVEALADGMEQYNQVMLAVCEEYDVLCVDVAAKLNGDTSYFYDDIHFNEKGSSSVAKIMWDELQSAIFDR